MSDLGPFESQRLIRDCLERKCFLEGMVIAKQAIAAFPPGIEFRVLLAEGFSLQGNLSRARELLEGAQRLAPTDRAVAAALLQLRKR